MDITLNSHIIKSQQVFEINPYAKKIRIKGARRKKANKDDANENFLEKKDDNLNNEILENVDIDAENQSLKEQEEDKSKDKQEEKVKEKENYSNQLNSIFNKTSPDENENIFEMLKKLVTSLISEIKATRKLEAQQLKQKALLLRNQFMEHSKNHIKLEMFEDTPQHHLNESRENLEKLHYDFYWTLVDAKVAKEKADKPMFIETVSSLVNWTIEFIKKNTIEKINSTQNAIVIDQTKTKQYRLELSKALFKDSLEINTANHNITTKMNEKNIDLVYFTDNSHNKAPLQTENELSA